MNTKRFNFLLVCISVLLIIALVVPTSFMEGASSTAIAAPVAFSDVASNYWASSAIRALTDQNILNGFPDGSFRPEESLTRAQVAKMMVLWRGLSPASGGASSFPDVPADHWADGFIAMAVQQGFVNGFPDGTYRPEDKVTKAQLLKLLVAAKKWIPVLPTSNPPTFPDTAENWVFTQGWLEAAVQQGALKTLVNGEEPQMLKGSSFAPEESVTRAQTCVLMDRCSGIKDGIGTPTPTPTSTSPTAKDIIVGFMAPLTGDSAIFGKSAQEGAELAVAEWNKKGGINGSQIVLKIADDKGDPTEGAAGITRLIEEEKIVANIGTVQSRVSLAIAPICQAKKIPMISPASTNEKVTLVGDYIFRACFIDNFQGIVGAAFAYDNLKVTKAACIFDAGNDYTKGLAGSFRDAFTRIGGTIVGFEAHPTGATDFNSHLITILANKPELIFISDYYFDAGLICNQARALGYKGFFLGGDGWDTPELVTIGGEAVEGGFFINHFSKDDTRPEVQTFVKDYAAKFSAAPDALSALAYDAANLLFDSIKRAGSTDGSKIRDAMAAANFKAVSGTITFDANRNPIKAAVIIEIIGGQQTYKATVQP